MNKVQVLERLTPLVDGELKHVTEPSGARVMVEPERVMLRPSRGARLVVLERKEGWHSLLQFAGLPQNVAKDLQPSTLADAVSQMLAKKDPFSMVMKNDEVTAVVPYRSATAMKPEKMMDVLEQVIPKADFPYMDIIPAKNWANIEVVGERTAPVKRGDLVRAGVKVDFSPMGVSAPHVASYASVLVCTNGATSDVVLEEFSGGHGEGDGVWQWFRQSVKHAYNSFDKVVDGFRKLANENVTPGNRAAMLEALITKAQLNPKAAAAVRALALEHPPANAWDMHNLITFASSHLLALPAERLRAQHAALTFGSETTHAQNCPVCHRKN